MKADAPIGIFDSGVGGLSVARQIRRQLPAEDLLYFADTAYCPYGGRPLEEIRSRSLLVARFLIERGAKLLVVACNSASGAALESLREVLPLPIVGIEPAVKPAAVSSRNRRIGVLATAATLQAERFDRLMKSYAAEVEVVSQPCPGLVELVESGKTDGAEVQEALAPILQPLRAAGVDTVVLGCTHYPFLAGAISQALGPGVTLIETGPAIARQTERVLNERGATAIGGGGGTLRVFTTGDVQRVSPVVERLWGEPVPVEHVDPDQRAETAAGQRRSSGAASPGGSSR